MKKLIFILMVVILCTAVNADYGKDTDYFVFVTQEGFAPAEITVPEDSYVKLINLEEKQTVVFEFNKFELEQYEYADVLFKRNGNYQFFIENDYAQTGMINVHGASNMITSAAIINYSGGGPPEYNITFLLDVVRSKINRPSMPTALQKYLQEKGLAKEVEPTAEAPTEVETEESGETNFRQWAEQSQKYVVKKSEPAGFTGAQTFETEQQETEQEVGEELPIAEEMLPTEMTQPVDLPVDEDMKAEPWIQEEKKSGFWTAIFVIILLIALVGIGLFVHKKLTTKKHVHVPHPHLVKYLKTYMGHGYSAESLKKHLMQYGHKEHHIEEALAHVMKKL